MHKETLFKEQEKNLNPQLPEPESTAKITFSNGSSVDFPILNPSKGAKMIDIRNLNSQTGN